MAHQQAKDKDDLLDGLYIKSSNDKYKNNDPADNSDDQSSESDEPHAPTQPTPYLDPQNFEKLILHELQELRKTMEKNFNAISKRLGNIESGMLTYSTDFQNSETKSREFEISQVAAISSVERSVRDMEKMMEMERMIFICFVKRRDG